MSRRKLRFLSAAVTLVGGFVQSARPAEASAMGNCSVCMAFNVCGSPGVWNGICQGGCGPIFYAVGCTAGKFCASVVTCRS